MIKVTSWECKSNFSWSLWVHVHFLIGVFFVIGISWFVKIAADGVADEKQKRYYQYCEHYVDRSIIFISLNLPSAILV